MIKMLIGLGLGFALAVMALTGTINWAMVSVFVFGSFLVCAMIPPLRQSPITHVAVWMNISYVIGLIILSLLHVGGG